MKSPTTSSSLPRVFFRPDSSHQLDMSPRTVDRNMPSISSPLSPRTQPLDIPSQARRRPALTSRQSSNNGPAAHLRLPSLPRFHPANYNTSQNSSHATTPVTGPNSPQMPPSPRAGSNRQYEVQKQMYLYQQQLLANTRQVRGSGQKPTSPRLAPMASPGAVTPLELEDEAGGYLTAGIEPARAAMHVEKLIRDEAARRGEFPPGRATSVTGR